MHHARRLALALGLLVTVATLLIIFRQTVEKRSPNLDTETAASNSFSLTSSAFANNQPIPAAYTCKGQNNQPPLTIGNVPGGAKSLALIMRDPDAVNGEWTHWLLWNINPSMKELAENSSPIGATSGTTSFGKPGYDGPCPPAGSGIHRYIFDLYALDASIDLPTTANRSQLDNAIKTHQLGHTELIGSFRVD